MSSNENDKGVLINQEVHFTYKRNADMGSLCQGDILIITDDLRNILKDVHPYFQNDHYKYFMVLTQSCDLVRRDGKRCKSPYRTLAAIRSYDDFLKKEFVSGKYVEVVDDFLLMDSKNRERASQLVERLYNNTESDYFFLYKDEALDFPESMVASLKVSIALKSEKHYDYCLAAKKIELSDEFKAKLGWLVGNMYSRVGTTDWESIKSKQERKEMLDEDLTSRCIIGSKEQLKVFKKELEEKKRTIKDHDEAMLAIANIQIPTKYEKVISIIEEALNQSGKKVSTEEKEKIMRAIRSRSALKTLLRDV